MKRSFTVALYLPLAVSCMYLASCGDDSPRPGPATLEGRFLDSPVGGLSYHSGDRSGTTDSQGEFNYEEGKSVRFEIGDIVIGDGQGRSIMTPVDLVPGASDESDPTVSNITRFLLTLDDDGDPSNGITIAEGTRAEATGRSVDFDQSGASFESDPNVKTVIADLTLDTTAGTRTLVSTQAAQGHLRTTLLGILAGSYSGTYSGDDSGTWTIIVDESGGITGSGTGQHAGGFDIWGTVTSSGLANFVGGSVSVGANFQGTITRDGHVSGTWASNGGTGLAGSFVGTKTPGKPRVVWGDSH